VGGISSFPAAGKLALAGGKGAPGESWKLAVIGQSSSDPVIHCNTGAVVCTFDGSRTQGSSTTSYAATNKPFDIAISTWTNGSFIGTAQNLQAIRTITVPGQVDQQVIDAVTIVFVATAK
jgi:hypothetical protein